MKDLIVVGAGGYGREVIQWAEDCNEQKRRWNILGFLDKDENALNGYDSRYPILGSDDSWEITENQEFAVAVANPQIKEKIVQRFAAKGAQFASIIHPTAFLPPRVSIGKGVIIYPLACISIGARLGDFCTIQTCGIGHDVTVGEYSVVSSFTNLMGHVEVGKGVFIGGNCAVVPSIKIGDGAYVGVGSVVLRHVRAGIKVFGNPAKKVDL